MAPVQREADERAAFDAWTKSPEGVARRRERAEQLKQANAQAAEQQLAEV